MRCIASMGHRPQGLRKEGIEMSRYSVAVESTAALAANTAFGWLFPTTTIGGKLRRVTIGCVAGATTPTSQQLVLQVTRTTNAGTTPGGTITGIKLDPNSAAASCVFSTTFATPPTLAASPSMAVAFNSQSGADLPWEMLEEFLLPPAATTLGIAFINADNALPASHKMVLSVEWEE